MITFSLPLIIGFRLLEKVRPKKPSNDSTNFVQLPAPINGFFINLLKLEGSIQKAVNIPAGTSLIAIYEKHEISSLAQ